MSRWTNRERRLLLHRKRVDMRSIPLHARLVLAVHDYVVGVHLRVHLRISKPAKSG